MRTQDQINALRATHKIPQSYGKGWEGPDGCVHFDLCDSTITIYPDGTAEETHMGLSFDEGHEFVTRPWRP